MNRRIISAVALVLVSSVANFVSAATFESGETPTTLLELFTSEGCSSCPPADAWISKLKTNGELWKSVVPVVWHVDYWDRLGWRDRFAKREFTARQRQYASEWQSGSVYTPAVVANGREWTGWSDATRSPAPGSVRVGILRIVSGDARQVSVSFTPASQPNQPLQVQVALLGADLQSHVARGENSGRNLHHDFVVLATATSILQRNGANYTASLTLPNETSDKPAALSAWVTSGEGKPPIQATGGWLK